MAGGLALLLGLGVSQLGGSTSEAADGKRLAVLELFTSQGCSSCPPADALLGELAKRPDVIALTLPVDYWDYLGWTDTLADPVHSTRQRIYARERGDHQVYTPQLVVDGARHCNGADLAAVEEAIAESRSALAGWQVPLKLVVEGDTFKVQVGTAKGGAEKAKGAVWLALVQSTATVQIARGENRGKDLTYHNVVRELVPVGKWSGNAATTLDLPPCRQMRNDIDACVVLLQEGMTGPILAAAQHTWR